MLHAHDLPPTLQTAEVSGTLPHVSLEQAVVSLERDLILDALKSARGSIARAARLLDSTERIIAYKVRKLGIEPGRFRASAKSHISVEDSSVRDICRRVATPAERRAERLQPASVSAL